MIAFEVAFIFVIAIISVVSIAALGRPLAQAYAEKLKTQYRDIGSQEAQNLKERLHVLESDILELRSQVNILQENNEYMTKMLEIDKTK